VNSGKSRRTAGGAATGSGMNFQAVVTAIAGVHLMRGIRLGWLEGVVDDTPVAVWAETSGPGDDIRLELLAGTIVEIQAKRGLQAGEKLWNPLISLATAINRKELDYGVLVVSPDSSRTIAYELSRDIKRLADCRVDGLSNLAKTLHLKLTSAGLPIQAVCQRLRIHTVHGLEVDAASIAAAKAELGHLCADQNEVNAAWNRLYRDASAIIERRGRWEASTIIRIFNAENIVITGCESPVGLLAQLARWVYDTNQNFSLFGIKKALSINQAWLPLKAVIADEDREADADVASALARYHASGENRSSRRDIKELDAEWIGRFYLQTVLVAGPGMGKSTLLTKAAQLYAHDDYPVLKVKLSMVAARMASGHSFFDSVLHFGLDGSGLSQAEASRTGLRDWVLLCDGLDECHIQQEAVATGLKQFAAGYPRARIVVTTRPIGYMTAQLSHWRHYELLSPDPDAGPSNLAALLQAVLPTTNKLHVNALKIATEELEKSGSTKIISRSPHLLVMAASMLARGGALGTTKVQLYENLFSLIDTAISPRTPISPVSQPFRTRMLDILGWELVSDPLKSKQDILITCSERLSVELNETQLKAQEIAANSLCHWEDIGLLEQVHHGTSIMLTFIHKTFTEFAAARYLRDLTPTDSQRSTVAALLEDSTGAEVLNFASGLGLADLIISVFLSQRESRKAELLDQMLQILVVQNDSVSPANRHQILELAFIIIDGDQSDAAFILGSSLADVAKAFPVELGREMATRLSNPKSWTRLISWTCVVEAGPTYYDLDDIPEALRSLSAEVETGMSGSLLGGLRLGYHKDRDLLQRFALLSIQQIMDRWPTDKAERYLETAFNSERFSTLGFQIKFNSLLRSQGWNIHLPDTSRTSTMLSAMQPSSDYEAASNDALRALLTSLLPTDRKIESIDLEDRTPLQLSAFLKIINFGEVAASDVWSWTEPYNAEMVREVMRALVALSPVDADILAREAAAMLRRLDDLQNNNIYRALTQTVSVDVPDPEWSKIHSINVDRKKLEQALTHGSAWLILAAANLLAELNQSTETDVETLLTKCKGYALYAVGYLASKLGGQTATRLLLARLQGPVVPGLEYLFITLKDLEEPWTDSLANGVSAGLLSSSVRVAEEAANLAFKYMEQGTPIQVKILEDAFEYWLANEEPYPEKGGVVPQSPREALLKALLLGGVVTDDRLIQLSSDARSDVRGVADQAIIERANASSDTRAAIVSAALEGKLPASLLARTLSVKTTFSPSEIARLRPFLDADDPKWRLAASKLLDPVYFDKDEICQEARKLANDSELEIRKAAQRILTNICELSN